MVRRPLIFSFAGLVTLWILCPWRLGLVLGTSMAPSLRNHQVIVIQENYYRHHQPSIGDVVVLSHNRETLVKRVSAVEGDSLWEVRDQEDGSFLLVAPSDLRRVQTTLRRSPRLGKLRHLVIPSGYVYVMGDAGSCSLDSRSFGPVPISNLRGRVMGL